HEVEGPGGEGRDAGLDAQRRGRGQEEGIRTGRVPVIGAGPEARAVGRDGDATRHQRIRARGGEREEREREDEEPVGGPLAERDRAPCPHPRQLPTRCRAIVSSWISVVPPPSSMSFASRARRSTSYSSMYPLPPRMWMACMVISVAASPQ